jgi:hypothetical protein
VVLFRPISLIALALLACWSAAAQVPTATGRTIAMSDPAWSLFIPDTIVHTGSSADILVHLHGDPATFRNNCKYANLSTIIVTVNYNGLSSAYETPFSNTALFGNILSEALTKVRAQADFPDNLNWGKIGLSSFSAGYGGVRQILKSSTYYNEISCLLAADSLYASFDANDKPLASQMADYRKFALDAANGNKTFFFSHSQVPTYTYSNTAETADDLMAYVGVTPSAVNFDGLGTLHFYRKAVKGKFTVEGATGSDGDSHLEHLRYGGEFLSGLPLAKVPEPGCGIPVLGMFMFRRFENRRAKVESR